MDLQFFAQSPYTAQIKVREAKVYRNSFKLKSRRIEASEAVKGIEHGKAVLPAGNPHSYFIPFLNHMIIIHGSSCIA